MNRTETLKIMAILRGAYPQFYRSIDRVEANDTVNLWMDMFHSDDFTLVAAAVKSLIESDEKGFPPHIGAVKAKIRLITGTDETTEMEAWSIVSNALKDGYYGAEAEFKKFPPVIKRIVGSPSQLRDWSMMDSQVVQSVVASNFQRSYKIAVQRERELEKLPPDVKKMVKILSSGRNADALPEKTEDELPADEPVANISDKIAELKEIFLESPDQTTGKKQGKAVKTGRSREDVLAILKSGGRYD